MEYRVKLVRRVKTADKYTNDIAEFKCDDFTFVAEIMNHQMNDLAFDQEYRVRVFFYGHALCDLYDSEKDFKKKNPGMDKEVAIPVGAYPLNPNIKNWRPSALNYINSTVVEVVPNGKYQQPDNYLLLTSKVGDVCFDQSFIYGSVLERPLVNEDQIITGIYWAELEIIKETKETN